MKRTLLYWLIASLIAPLLAIIFKNDLGGLIFIFWPSAIMLLSLGAEQRPLIDILYVWSMAVGSNILLYLLIGFILSKARTLISLTKNEKT